jgi:6-phospho-beta-glucosidase
MKIALIGAGGVRTPLLVEAFCCSKLPLETLALYDTDRKRLEAMASISRHLSGGVSLEICESSAEAIENADFVFTSIRVGGFESRAHDEAVTQAHSIAGQETVGPGGMAMALRNAQPLIGYAREVAQLAPDAWLVNFTNPVGILTQVVQEATQAKVIGICDTPTELFAEVARALGLERSQCHFDYFGLNHLGWLREVYVRGEPRIHLLWNDAEKLARIYRAPLFEPEFLASLKLLPTEYLYYYYRSQDAFENTRRAGVTRGQTIRRLNRQLFRDLARRDADELKTYRTYLADRDAGYFEIESGESTSSDPDPTTGYHQIALAVVQAIHFYTGATLPLNVRNQGNFPFLEEEDVVEVPCAVGSNGPLALQVEPVPDGVGKLMAQVKGYERLTVQAALTRSRELAIEALANHPLVEDLPLARKLMDALEVP